MKTGKYTTEIIHRNLFEKKKIYLPRAERQDAYAPLLEEYQKPLCMSRRRIVNKKARKKLDDD